MSSFLTENNLNKELDIEKIKTYLKKSDFYNFFIDYVPGSFDSMKREMSEIVAKNRKMTKEKALLVRSFRVSEAKKFIISNDLQEHFFKK
ncbi:hypothetical protein [uncultured Tenacibaculum sp.]|uniref:hypothetical protein n=1 Tax=uncultured Tenacibaculum sp. TaxID=174713 RepID=UPI002631565F|nr:hypothetical protein [uncultured Tenacibaculum sp.]